MAPERSPLPDDRALIAGLVRGHASAFDALYEREHQAVFAFLRRMTRDRAEAEDAYQDTWVSAAEAAPRLVTGSHLRAWLFQIARNHVRMRRRSAFERTRVDEEPDASPSVGDEARLVARIELGRVEAALAVLDLDLREALLLSVIEGFDARDAAAMVGTTEVAFRKRLSRARQAILSVLDDADAEEGRT